MDEPLCLNRLMISARTQHTVTTQNSSVPKHYFFKNISQFRHKASLEYRQHRRLAFRRNCDQMVGVLLKPVSDNRHYVGIFPMITILTKPF
jgi:hypothetical protein